jgi:hypothetical protein
VGEIFSATPLFGVFTQPVPEANIHSMDIFDSSGYKNSSDFGGGGYGKDFSSIGGRSDGQLLFFPFTQHVICIIKQGGPL